MAQLVNPRTGRRAGCLDSSTPHIAKRATPHRCPGTSGEYQTGRAGRVGGEMGRQRVNDNLRQRDHAHRRRRLWRRYERLAARDGQELLIDTHNTPQKVDPVDGEAERLALPHACPRGQDDKRSIPSGHSFDHRPHCLGRQRLNLLARHLRQPRPVARIRGDQPVAHCRLEHASGNTVRQDHRARREALRGALPSLHIARLDRRQRLVAERRIRVSPQRTLNGQL
jgi:hypothetical protein